MCGIVGALCFKNSSFQISETYIEKLRDSMAHRGPDAYGTWISQNCRVGLGHRRLSIIDLSKEAEQPMSNEDESIWVSFNGEIYNHMDIRRELNNISNHRWKTHHSDTEVIVHAFEQWGIDCIHKFRGMFAIALWDDINKELWLIRDRIGIKPLYYSVHNGRIVFASEIKALLQDTEQKREVNEVAFYNYLSFLTTPAPNTLFDGIKKLSSGTFLRVKENGHIMESRYWDVWNHTKPLTGMPEDDIAENILSELKTSVHLRKTSDVPVGIFLSGGIDSSTNAALFSEDEDNPVKTFSIGYHGDYSSYKNELHYARKMASEVNALYHERLLDVNDLIDFLPKMVYLQDEPIADPVCVPVYYLSKIARDNGVKVCQVGEGADELFWGYPFWKRMLKLQRYNNIPFTTSIKKIVQMGLQAYGKKHSGPYEWIRRGVSGQPIFWGGAEAFTDSQKQMLISRRLRKKFLGYTSWEPLRPIRDQFEQNAWDTSHLNWMSYIDLNLRLPELLLMRVDKMSMGVSLEARVPFLDHKFVELAMSIPSSLKTKNNTLKYILKKSVRGVIPDELIDRKKQGFGVPIYEWFFEKLGDKTRRELSSFCSKTDFLDQKEVMKLVETGNGPQVWYLLNFALWLKEYIP